MGDRKGRPYNRTGDERTARLRRSARLAPPRRGARATRPRATCPGARRVGCLSHGVRDRCRGPRRRGRRWLARCDVPCLLPLRRAPHSAAVRGRVAASAAGEVGGAGRAAVRGSRARRGDRGAFTERVHGSAIPHAQDHLDLFPARVLAIGGNSLGTLAVVAVALATFRRRPVGNGLILCGIGAAAAGSALSGLGEAGVAAFLAAAALLLYAGVASPR
jgi:hypothetical protein